MESACSTITPSSYLCNLFMTHQTSLLIENASVRYPAPPQKSAPRCFRSRLATIWRELPDTSHSRTSGAMDSACQVPFAAVQYSRSQRRANQNRRRAPVSSAHRFWRARRAFSKSSTILPSEVPAPPSREFIHRRPVIGPPMLPIPIVLIGACD